MQQTQRTNRPANSREQAKDDYYICAFVGSSQYSSTERGRHPRLHFVLLPTLPARLLPEIFGFIRFCVDTVAPVGMYQDSDRPISVIMVTSCMLLLHYIYQNPPLHLDRPWLLWLSFVINFLFNLFCRNWIFRWGVSNTQSQAFRTFIVHAPCLVVVLFSHIVIRSLLIKSL